MFHFEVFGKQTPMTSPCDSQERTTALQTCPTHRLICRQRTAMLTWCKRQSRVTVSSYLHQWFTVILRCVPYHSHSPSVLHLEICLWCYLTYIVQVRHKTNQNQKQFHHQRYYRSNTSTLYFKKTLKLCLFLSNLSFHLLLSTSLLQS